jgi:hypothetical protein
MKMMPWWRELTSWWNDVRIGMAFVVAPLAAPVVVSMKFGFSGEPENTISIVAPTSLVLGYLGIILLGPPVYLALRALKLTAFWIAPLAGFAVGVGMLCLFLIMLPLNLGQNLATALASLDYGLLKMAVEDGGPPGAAVGAILWLIARPDRQRRSVSATE